MSKPIKIISNGYRYDPLDRLISDNSTQFFIIVIALQQN